MELQDRLSFFRELISCTQTIYYWCLDGEGRLIASSCPEETLFFPIFRHSGCLDYALEHQPEVPMILSNASNALWAAVWELRGGARFRLHVIGPCLAAGFSFQTMWHARQTVAEAGGASLDDYQKRLLAGLEQIPVLPLQVFLHYAAMLGYCVTSRKISLSKLHHQQPSGETPAKKQPPQDRMNIYQAERLLLRAVRDGDVDSQFALDNASRSATLQPYVPDPQGQAQIAYTILTSLCVRAAIEGGLSPELAYSAGDRYIQKLFLTHTLTEAAALKTQMFQELTGMVRKCRETPKSSKPIQSCRDYIETHLEEPLSIELLAARLGYTKYYLSRCFKEEMGCTVNCYIQIARVERAKALLACTDLSIVQIAERLQFSSASHFSTVFKRLAGQPPAQYRAEQQTF